MQRWETKEYTNWLLDPNLHFGLLAKKVWSFQSTTNPHLIKYLQYLGKNQMTYIPISFFKAFEMKSGEKWQEQMVFESSGTTGQVRSRHLVKDIQLYERMVMACFFHFMEKDEYRIHALLPSYLERGNSSLVYMTKVWMDQFGLPGSGYYLYNFEALEQSLSEAIDAGERILLIGVAFALYDFASTCQIQLPEDAIIIETGGMKGRKEELTRSELHKQLKAGLGVSKIYSEYGMTELMSQAYTLGDEKFWCPPWMKVEITDIHIPYLTLPTGHTGRIQIMDLANIHTCSFISTDDLGRMYEDGSFEVLGRIDQSELRGCSLMYE